MQHGDIWDKSLQPDDIWIESLQPGNIWDKSLQPGDIWIESLQHGDISEMEKRADGADASVLFFSLGCANFLAVHVQTS